MVARKKVQALDDSVPEEIRILRSSCLVLQPEARPTAKQVHAMCEALAKSPNFAMPGLFVCFFFFFMKMLTDFFKKRASSGRAEPFSPVVDEFGRRIACCIWRRFGVAVVEVVVF